MNLTAPVRADGDTRSAFGELARREALAYAHSPGLILGVAVCLPSVVVYVDRSRPANEFDIMLGPAAFLGLIGLFVAANRVRVADRLAAAAGATPTTVTTRTKAHLVACVVPAIAATVYFAVFANRLMRVPPPEGSFPSLMPRSWTIAGWFGQTVLAAIGGPVLGIVVARRFRHRAAPLLAAFALVVGSVVMQGIAPWTRRPRLAMPYTYWGGPLGTRGEPDRVVALAGSPWFWDLYLIVLIVIGATVAIGLSDPHRAARTRRRIGALTVAAALAVACAVWSGPAERVGPSTVESTLAPKGSGPS